MRGLSLVAASGGHSSSRCAGLSLSRPLFVAEHKLQTRKLSSCGSQAQLLRGMWDLPRPGLEPVSPALADRFSTAAPPGKPPNSNRLPRCVLACIYSQAKKHIYTGFFPLPLGAVSSELLRDCFPGYSPQ